MVRHTASGRTWEFLADGVRRLGRRENIAAWVVAGTAAYFLWVRPERKKLEERQVRKELVNDRLIFCDRKASWSLPPHQLWKCAECSWWVLSVLAMLSGGFQHESVLHINQG
jgi:hypothetical protein